MFRYIILPSGETDYPYAVIQEMRRGRAWPRFWKPAWHYAQCVSTYRTIDAAERAIGRLS